jgi:hypothetical protein
MTTETKELIAGERAYQNLLWSDHKHTTLEYLVYILDYTEEALHVLSRFEPGDKARTCVRKIAALAVAGISERDGSPDTYFEHDALKWIKREKSLEYYLAKIKMIAFQALAEEVDEDFLLDNGPWAASLEAIRDCAIVCLNVHGAPPRDVNDLLVRERKHI